MASISGAHYITNYGSDLSIRFTYNGPHR